MDLDSLKDRSKRLKAPQVPADGLQLKPQTTDDLISALKEIERKEYQQLKKAIPLWGIAIALFLFSLVAALMVSEDVRLVPTLILRIMSVVLFVVVAILLVLKIRSLSKIDYSENVRIFLEKAEKRFTFPGKSYWLFPFFLVILIAYGAHFYISDVLIRYFDVGEPWVGFGISVAFYTAVFVIGYIATRSNWNKERTPLLEEIRRMRADLSSEDGSESGM